MRFRVSSVNISDVSTYDLKHDCGKLEDAIHFIDEMKDKYGSNEWDHDGRMTFDKIIKELGRRCLDNALH